MADEPIESKRPRRSVVLGILAPVLLLLVGTASAQEQGIQQPGGDACPSTISSAGFLDIGDLSSESVHAIDCLAHYGITTGTSPTTYSPGDYLTRSQMARFLIRTAEALGVEIPAGDSTPFEDISGLGANGQRSVVRLYELGITTGRRPGMFSSGRPPRTCSSRCVRLPVKKRLSCWPAPSRPETLAMWSWPSRCPAP